MKFHDAHIHFLYQCSSDELRRIFNFLESIGMAGFNALVISEFPSRMDTVLKMVPGEYHPYTTSKALENQRDPFPVFNEVNQLKIVPFLHARFIQHNIEAKIKVFRERGFKGLKVLYVPEGDAELRIGGMEQAFARTRKQSEKITLLLIENASLQGMSILMHADLRRYGKFVEEMIRCYPQTNFNIPHFGFSRKAISILLDKYPNCYTDLSALKPFMEKNPEPYREFIKCYQDRILFGSDASIEQPENIQSTLKFLNQFLDDTEIFHKLANRNYLAFHGIA